MTATNYNVRYFILDANCDGVQAHRRTNVIITEGYSTIDDIPRILAVSHFGTADAVRRIEIRNVEYIGKA